MIEVLDRVTRENMHEQLERFRRALEHDQIEPMDFSWPWHERCQARSMRQYGVLLGVAVALEGQVDQPLE